MEQTLVRTLIGGLELLVLIKGRYDKKVQMPGNIQGQPLGIDIMYLVLADRNMHVRFGLKVVWGS